MNIQMTQKLLDKMKLPAVGPTDQNAFFDWHASYVVINRRNTVVLMNDLSRYSLILYGLKAADLKKIATYFQQGLSEILLAEEVDKATIDLYFEKAGPIGFTRTSDRTITGQISQIGQELPYFEEDFIEDQIIQTDFNLKFGTHVQKVGKEYVDPRELLLKAMEQFRQDKQTVFSTDAILNAKPVAEKAFIFSVELPCGENPIWRKLAVPARSTFEKFHKILQVSFNWQNVHLHQFQIIADNGNVVAESSADGTDEYSLPDQQFFDYFNERKRLSSFLPLYHSIRYLYDFGDDWLHTIELEQAIENYEGALPCCLDGEGTAPPEDVGGEGGYLEFLSVIEGDTDSEQKQEMLNWASSQRWKEFNLQEINRRLKGIIGRIGYQ